MADIKEVTDDTFQTEVLNADRPVLVDFWAPWCGPCQMVTPVIEALADEMASTMKFVKLNTDDNMRTAQAYRILGIPALLLFHKGEEADRVIGFRPKDQLKRQIEKALSAVKEKQ